MPAPTKSLPLVLSLATFVASPSRAQDFRDETGSADFRDDTFEEAPFDDGERPAEPVRAPAPSRRALLAIHNGFSGSTGLLHTVSADSGGTGTFRLSVIGNLYTGSEFLCPGCENANGDVLEGSDDVSRVSSRFALSVTPASFLEAYGTLAYETVSNDRGEPRIFQLVGDTAIGLKAFSPKRTDVPFSAGGGVELGILNGVGSVGPEALNVAVFAAGTLDFSDLARADARAPLRAHVNARYTFDNSGSLADTIEGPRSAAFDTPKRITRVERFGFDIDRVDSLRLATGAELTFDFVRPFAEWSVDLPVNRQGYDCRPDRTTAGDRCLDRAGFSAVPSRATLGLRAYPWVSDWMEGLMVLAAADIGTSGTATFVEELSPEVPWSAYLGLGYGFDTAPRVQVVERVVERRVATEAPPAPHVAGIVVDASSGEALPGAGVFFEGRDENGFITSSTGAFRTPELAPGSYSFLVTRDGYETSRCTAAVTAATATEPVKVRCALRALPRVANLSGVVRDAETSTYVSGASVRITDPRGRHLSLTTDERGAFRFENVPAGTSRLDVEAEAYAGSVLEVLIQPRKDAVVELVLERRHD